VHPAEQRADRGALRGRREQHALAGEPLHHRRRLFLQRRQRAAVVQVQRRRAGNLALRQVLHQAEEERQVGGIEPLEQRQHETTVHRVDVVIGVLDAFADALEAEQLGQRVLAQELDELGVRDFGEDRQRTPRIGGMGSAEFAVPVELGARRRP
jgi:hypothetical protein